MILEQGQMINQVTHDKKPSPIGEGARQRGEVGELEKELVRLRSGPA